MKNICKLVFAGTLALIFAPTAVHAHPLGSAVSTGTNPIVNAAGRRSDGPGFETVLTAPADQDIVITDLVFSVEPGGSSQPILKLASTGTIVGRYFIYGANFNGGGLTHLSLQTGLRVPAGDTLQLDPDSWNILNYSLTGYYAQP